jgi:hypothetical protein
MTCDELRAERNHLATASLRLMLLDGSLTLEYARWTAAADESIETSPLARYWSVTANAGQVVRAGGSL